MMIEVQAKREAKVETDKTQVILAHLAGTTAATKSATTTATVSEDEGKKDIVEGDIYRTKEVVEGTENMSVIKILVS